MQRLAEHLPTLSDIKRICSTKENDYFTHTYIENHPITEQTISIIMTSSNRSKQVFHTFKTFLQSKFKDIHIVLVDDSDQDPVLEEDLRNFPFAIDFIRMDRSKKFWINPCVNYTIGFQFSRGSKLILQNSEVCHVGDVLSFVSQNTRDGEYLVFDVKASYNYDTNESIYSIIDTASLDTSIYNAGYFKQWYQHSTVQNRQLHFLVCFTKNTLQAFHGFSLDYAFSADYDDDDLLLRVQLSGTRVRSISHESTFVGGIHLYHTLAHSAWTKHTSNESIYKLKKAYAAKHSRYWEISDGTTLDEQIQRFQHLEQVHK